MAKKYLKLAFEKGDFNSVFYDELEREVFKKNKFALADGFFNNAINKKFNIQINLNNFIDSEPEIETVYFDLDKGLIQAMVINFYNQDNQLIFALVKYCSIRRKYEMIYCHPNSCEIKTKEYNQSLYNNELSTLIKNNILNQGFESLSALSSNIYLDKDLGQYIVSQNRVSNDTKNILKIILRDRLSAAAEEDIQINNLTIDIFELENPYFYSCEFTYLDSIYSYYFSTGIIENIGEITNSDKVSSYRDAIIELADENYKKLKGYIIKEYLLAKDKDLALKALLKLDKKYKLIEIDEGYGYKEFGDAPFIFFDEHGVDLFTSKNIDDENYETFSYDQCKQLTKEFKEAYFKYKNSPYPGFKDFLKSCDHYLNTLYNLEDSKRIAEDLLKQGEMFPVFEKEKNEYISRINKVKEKYSSFLDINNEKVSLVLEVINKIIDIDNYERYVDDLFDAYEELTAAEKAAVKDKFNDFLELFADLPNYISMQNAYRRVFIRKRTLDEIKKIDREQTNLNIIANLNSVVDKLKTLPALELSKYLISKGLNRPIKEDRRIKKIRIMNHAKYRILFVYGRDLKDENRIANQDSIYIFGVTEHKKDKGELYQIAATVPDKYEINDFIIYSKQDQIKIPECTDEQYKIAMSYEDRPVITFGCAGSGKTTVSIEKYVNFVYSHFNCVSPENDELVYVTFHKGLSEKAKKDLDEFKINGNCFKLDQYFAYVLGETYNENAAVNEYLFISWFDQNYSEDEIKKNKGKKKSKITPLINKPDKARLIYTYYRGVFKGSKKLFKTRNFSLTQDEFLFEMESEQYLTKEEKLAIYLICSEFDEYVTQNGFISDNDYAIKVIRQASYNIKKTNRIIIDEVQDLTEIEIIAVILTLKDDSTRIYFYGDPHQSINPNVFDGSTINKVYSELGKITSSESAPLTITYRTNKHLISYLNQLLKYRDEWIGLTKGGISQIIEPPKMDEDTSWAGYVTNRDLYKKIFECNPNSMVITPSESKKRELLAKYENEITKERVLTIYEAKGMEWETVIMYGMFSDYEPYFIDMISNNGKARKSTIHRMTFNKFYVGCTRSTKSFVIIEENEDVFNENNLIFTTLLSSFAPIYKEEQINTYILEDNTFDAWYKEALQNLENDNPATFNHALMHAKKLAVTKEQNIRLNKLAEGKPEILKEIAFENLAQGEYDLARSAFFRVYKSNKECGHHITLCDLLRDKVVKDEFLKKMISKSDLWATYPQVLPKIINHPYFIKHMHNIFEKLFKKEN